jgi:hypothetical protein
MVIMLCVGCSNEKNELYGAWEEKFSDDIPEEFFYTWEWDYYHLRITCDSFYLREEFHTDALIWGCHYPIYSYATGTYNIEHGKLMLNGMYLDSLWQRADTIICRKNGPCNLSMDFSFEDEMLTLQRIDMVDNQLLIGPRKMINTEEYVCRTTEQ